MLDEAVIINIDVYLISTCITGVDLNPSELEVLRQRNSELEAKNVELEAKIVSLKNGRAILNEEKIDELNAENAVLVDEIFELKSENAKLRNPEARYYSMSLSNIAYSILEKLGDDIVNDKDFT